MVGKEKNTADGVELPTGHANHLERMVSIINPANRHTTEHTKSTLLRNPNLLQDLQAVE